MNQANAMPVIIVGAGPVGFSLATALIHQGIRVEIFEALPQLSLEIRASTFHPATLEMFAEWGVVEHVLAQGQQVNRLVYWERRARRFSNLVRTGAGRSRTVYAAIRRPDRSQYS